MKKISVEMIQQFVNINLDIYTELDKSIVEPYEKVAEIVNDAEQYLEAHPECSTKYRAKIEHNNFWIKKLLENQTALIDLHLRTGATRQVILERDLYKEEIQLLNSRLDHANKIIKILVSKLPEPQEPNS